MPIRAFARVNDRLYGYRGFVLWTLILLVATAILVQTEILSDVQWTGVSVHGVDQGGIVYYSFGGQHYSLDRTSDVLSPNTVYLDPADPEHSAVLGNALAKYLGLAAAIVPFLGALVVAGFGLRRRRRARAGDPRAREFGHGLDSDRIHQLVLERRRLDRGQDPGGRPAP